MTQEQNRNASYAFFFFSFSSFCLLLQTLATKDGLDRLFFCVLHGFGFIFNLRLAVELYRKSKDPDLK
jgi:hypothetical protein